MCGLQGGIRRRTPIEVALRKTRYSQLWTRVLEHGISTLEDLQSTTRSLEITTRQSQMMSRSHEPVKLCFYQPGSFQALFIAWSWPLQELSSQYIAYPQQAPMQFLLVVTDKNWVPWGSKQNCKGLWGLAPRLVASPHSWPTGVWTRPGAHEPNSQLWVNSLHGRVRTCAKLKARGINPKRKSGVEPLKRLCWPIVAARPRGGLLTTGQPNFFMQIAQACSIVELDWRGPRVH